MTDKEIQLKDKIVQQAVKSVRRDKKVDVVSLLSISKELSVEFSEITKYYSSMEDIFSLQQKDNWKTTYKTLDKNIKKAKTPGDFKKVFEMVTGLRKLKSDNKV